MINPFRKFFIRFRKRDPLKHTSILVITDTVGEHARLVNNNAPFIPRLTTANRRLLEGPQITVRFVAVGQLMSSSCGLRVDAIINLSSVNPEEFRHQLIPCVMF